MACYAQKTLGSFTFITTVYLDGVHAPPAFFVPLLNVHSKKMFHQGAGGEIFLIQMDGNFPPFST